MKRERKEKQYGIRKRKKGNKFLNEILWWKITDFEKQKLYYYVKRTDYRSV